MASLQTEYSFTLPKGYVDPSGRLHRTGTMRLATARDEIEPLRDQRVTGPDDPYLTILVLARVVTDLGALRTVGVAEIENLFAADLAFLQDLYGIINFGSADDVAALEQAAGVADDNAGTSSAAAGADLAEESLDDDEEDDVDDVPAAFASSPSPAAGRRRDRIEEVSHRSAP